MKINLKAVPIQKGFCQKNHFETVIFELNGEVVPIQKEENHRHQSKKYSYFMKEERKKEIKRDGGKQIKQIKPKKV